MSMSLIRRLLAGLLDVIGDIHGKRLALEASNEGLGYRSDGTYPGGKIVVFVGGLCDRGPDSPGVIQPVAQWGSVQTDRCVCPPLRVYPTSGDRCQPGRAM